MDFNPVVLAIPIYFLLIGVELVYQQVKKVQLYRLNDAATNISCGIIQQITGLFFKVGMLSMYQLVYEHLRFFTIEATWYNLIILFVLADFCYYWAHRMSHEINLFWGGHVVHHQSEDYNLSVALRQGSFQVFWTFWFYLPLAFVGFDTLSFVAMSGLVTVYQFWIHTETIGKLGWLEYIFNTPSHHRVHHGRNPKYIDRNHAGVFIIWDKMFGTFKKEEERPIYGITTPVNSWNPLWTNIQHYSDLFTSLKKSKGLKNTLGLLFHKPGWFPKEMGGYRAITEVEHSSYIKYNQQANIRKTGYSLFQYAVAMAGTLIFLFYQSEFQLHSKIAFALLLILTITVCGGLFDNKSWVNQLEWLRLFMCSVFLFYINFEFQLSVYLQIVFISYFLVSVICFYMIQKSFRNIPIEKTAHQ